VKVLLQYNVIHLPSSAITPDMNLLLDHGSQANSWYRCFIYSPGSDLTLYSMHHRRSARKKRSIDPDYQIIYLNSVYVCEGKCISGIKQLYLINASKVSFLFAPCFMLHKNWLCVSYSYHGTCRVPISSPDIYLLCIYKIGALAKRGHWTPVFYGGPGIGLVLIWF
jgi:hypothetical protein